MRPNQSCSLADFRSELNRRLAAMSALDVAAALLTLARRLTDEGRTYLLECLVPREEPAARPDLLAAIAELRARLEQGEYDLDGESGYDAFADSYSGAWDDEEEVPLLDQAWEVEADDLFDQAAERFAARDWATAAAAYQGLLELRRTTTPALDDYGGEVSFGNLTVDTVEALHRLMAASYLAAPPTARVPAVLKAVDLAWPDEAAELRLSGMVEQLGEPPPEFESFLGKWLAHWTKQLPTERKPNPSPVAYELSVETASLLDGTAGLAALARRHGASHALFYHRWAAVLVAEGAPREAVAAGREGVACVREAAGRAWVADGMAEAALAAGDAAARHEAHLAAWINAPTFPRLVALFGPLAESPEELRQTALDLLEQADAGQYDVGGSLACALQLLAGEDDRPMRALEAAPAVGWSSARHVGPIVLPTLLLSQGAARPPGRSCLAELLVIVDAVGAGWQGWPDDPTEPPGGPAPSLGALLEAAAARLHPSGAEHRLAVALRVAERRARAILDARRRGAYDRAARCLLAVVEGHLLGAAELDGVAWLEAIRDGYKRLIAFQGAVDGLIRASAILPDHLARKR